MLLTYPADRPERSRILSIEKSPITHRFPEGFRGIAGDALREAETGGFDMKTEDRWRRSAKPRGAWQNARNV